MIQKLPFPMQSISDKSWATILSITPPESPLAPRLGAKESNSSKKITHGVAALARSKTRIFEKSLNQYIIMYQNEFYFVFSFKTSY